MKKIYTAIITSILSLQTLAISAGNVADYAQSTTSGNSIVYINAPRFVRPLIEKWIAEYKKLKPEANFAIAKTQAAKNSSLLNILLSDVNPSEKTDKKTVFFGSYAILPITSKDSDAAKSLENRSSLPRRSRLFTLKMKNWTNRTRRTSSATSSSTPVMTKGLFQENLQNSTEKTTPASVENELLEMICSSSAPFQKIRKE